MKIEQEKIENLIPYGFNNRIHSDEQIDRIANSIKEFGFNQPIVIDSSKIVIVGHGRLMAAKKLGLSTVPVVRKTDLTEAQIKAYRILDNKLQDDSQWDFENVKLELTNLEELNFDFKPFGLQELSDLLKNEIETTDTIYSAKIESPVYKPTGKRPTISQLYEARRYHELCSQIESIDALDPEIKKFLLYAAQRHITFNYEYIAEFYAHADKDIQALFEDSALVIIDFKKAIEKGFVKLTKALGNTYESDYD